jgi:hypothetical protein
LGGEPGVGRFLMAIKSSDIRITNTNRYWVLLCARHCDKCFFFLILSNLGLIFLYMKKLRHREAKQTARQCRLLLRAGEAIRACEAVAT